MAILYTTRLSLPYPNDNEYLKDVPDFIRALAQAADKGRIPVYATSAERDAEQPSPAEGTICYLKDNNPVPRLAIYLSSTGWTRIWPAQPTVLSGTAAPTGTAEAGTIYVQY